MGIEVEVENALPLPCQNWAMNKDNSLRNDGIEFVTNYGLRVQSVKQSLTELANLVFFAREQGHKFTFSERTSIHVHLDCRSLTLADVKNLVLIYTIFEDSLFKFAGDHRRHNVFCVPIRFINMSGYARRDVKWMIEMWKKYCALNLLRLHDFGTIEFRHMEGNLDVDRITTWVYLLAAIRDYAKMVPTESVMEEIKKLKYISHYEQFAQQVFGPLSAELILDGPEIDQAVSDAKQLFNLRTE